MSALHKATSAAADTFFCSFLCKSSVTSLKRMKEVRMIYQVRTCVQQQKRSIDILYA